MDFFSRLIGSGGAGAGASQKSAATNGSGPARAPQHRLAAFKRTYSTLLSLWANGAGPDAADAAFVAENVRLCLHRLAELLDAEQRGPTPHPCVGFCAASRLLATVARAATAFGHDGLTHEALEIARLLIDSEEEAFLEDRGFAAALPGFAAGVRAGDRVGDPAAEAAMVEVLFGVAAKLRLEPHVLRVWFRPEEEEEEEIADEVEEGEALAADERRTRREEFPLFYILLDYVPVEGRSGEFARMGLLYIIEAAAHSASLERWIVEGDIAALMASGLGALYSQLSRKLALTYRKGEEPAILTFSDRLKSPIPADAEATTSASYQTHISTFLASLVFWQDILEHCTSVDVKQTLLDHFKYLFLQQLLYPSLLESSDIDGGSSVAVLTYLRCILESIDNPDLVQLTLGFLFGLQDASAENGTEPKTPLKIARRRKSQDLLTTLASQNEQVSPDLFNLSDLIMASLRSSSQQTVTATLHILSAMLRRPHHQALTTLLKTHEARPADELRTVGAHEMEVDQILTLAEGLTPFEDLETSYEQHLHDNRNTLESHACSVDLLKLPVPQTKTAALGGQRSSPTPRILQLEDPTLKALLALLEQFFANDIETNLGLTQVFIDLATCGYTRLEGWLLSMPSVYTFPHPPRSPAEPGPEAAASPDPDELQIRAIQAARRQPTIHSDSASPFLQILSRLSAAVNSFRRSIPDFEAHLLTTRAIINPSPPPTSATPRIPFPSGAVTTTTGSAAGTPSKRPASLATSASRSPSRRPLPSSLAQAPATPTSPTRATPLPIPAHLPQPGPAAAGLSSSPRGRALLPSAEPSAASTPRRSPVRAASPFTGGKGTPMLKPIPAGAATPAPAPPVVPTVLRRRVVAATGRDAARGATAAAASPTSPDRGDGSDAESDLAAHAASDDDDADEEEPEGRMRRAGRRASSAQGAAGSRMAPSAPKSAESGLDEAEGAADEDDSGAGAAGPRPAARAGEVALGALLTNVIVLQEFALEVAALVEARAGLFGELTFFKYS